MILNAESSTLDFCAGGVGGWAGGGAVGGAGGTVVVIGLPQWAQKGAPSRAGLPHKGQYTVLEFLSLHWVTVKCLVAPETALLIVDAVRYHTAMETKPTVPNPSSVRDKRDQFDNKFTVVERALAELFRQYPTNDDEAHVLLKVVALNRLYSTGILAVEGVARHIYEHAEEVDGALKGNPPSPEVVDQIVAFTIPATGRREWSFATKYCSWHRPESYPIWDSNVARYLRSLKGSDFTRPDNWKDYPQFADYGGRAADGRWRPDNWTYYREFAVLMNRFRDFYNLRSFTFKEIDKFLWLSGEELRNRRSRS